MPWFDEDTGKPVLDEKKKQIMLKVSQWLDRFKPVQQMTWAPGLPQIIRGRLVRDGGWVNPLPKALPALSFEVKMPTITKDGKTEVRSVGNGPGSSRDDLSDAIPF